MGDGEDGGQGAPEFARHVDPENIAEILRIPTPYNHAYTQAYERALAHNPKFSQELLRGVAYVAAHEAQDEAFWQAADKNAAVVPEWIIIQRIVKEHVAENPGPEGWLSPVIGTDIFQNPGDLLDLLAGAEKAYTPEFIEEHKDLWNAESPLHQDAEDPIRFNALQKIFTVYYGDRWLEYQRAANFDFTTWHAELDPERRYPGEETAMYVAKILRGENQQGEGFQS